jgi:hypothetical protein
MKKYTKREPLAARYLKVWYADEYAVKRRKKLNIKMDAK